MTTPNWNKLKSENQKNIYSLGIKTGFTVTWVFMTYDVICDVTSDSSSCVLQ